uniref:Uncharacterized protein n=1 Tax=Panagrolaimus sp. JU765 TaxID=591449 RepID=A0AC34RNP3_9BILA
MQQHSPTRDYASRSNYAPTTPQLRRYDFNIPPVSPTLPRHASPTRRISPRRVVAPYVAPQSAMPVKQQLLSDSDSVSLPQILYLQKSPLETHKCRMKNKLKYALFSLSAICFFCSLTAYFSYHHSSSNIYGFYQNASDEKPEMILGHSIHIRRHLRPIIFVVSWSTFITSIGTLFVVGNQLACALKIAKINPDCPPAALKFLVEAKLIRTTTIFFWLLSVLCFVFILPSSVWCMALEDIPRGICAAIGLAVGILCLFSFVQCVYGICKSDYPLQTHFSMDDGIEGGGYYARENAVHNFSTLV